VRGAELDGAAAPVTEKEGYSTGAASATTSGWRRSRSRCCCFEVEPGAAGT
jgi:hypothetical protein